jgi:hypothetical protein
MPADVLQVPARWLLPRISDCGLISDAGLDSYAPESQTEILQQSEAIPNTLRIALNRQAFKGEALG